MLILGLILFAACSSGGTVAGELPLDSLTLPPGFSVQLYARVPGAREMTLSPSGVLYVGTRSRSGKVYAVPDRDQDGLGDRVIEIASGLNSPNGVAFRNGALYVGEIHRVIRYPDIENDLEAVSAPEVVNDTFPRESHHGWKFIRFGPDGRLYVPVGAPCNACERSDERFGTILRMQPDGTGLEIFARGIRNTVGFDWRPETGVLWFTDNGRDWLGDDLPADELNRAPEPGLHFGFPYCHQGDLPDPELGAGRDCAEFVPPAAKLAPHVASLGMRFYAGTMFPESYRGQIFIAEHGSWNRSTPLGYRITRVELDGEGNAVAYEVFVEGWLQGDSAWGRPVDVLVMPDGALLVSDDHAGAVYRITHSG
jgi:glucose/arabinose dehydrogenase